MRYFYYICLLQSLLLLKVFNTSGMAQALLPSVADSLIGVLQHSKPGITRVQTLLTLSAFYLNKTLDPKHDLDSAMILVRQAENLSQSLTYGAGVEEAIFLMGKIFIKQQKTDMVQGMLESLSDTNRIKLLLELGKDKLRPTYTQKANPDSAIVFFLQAQIISEKIKNQKWNDESKSLTGVAYLLDGKIAEGKAYFMQVIEACRRAGDKAGEINAWLKMATTTFCEDCREHISILDKALALSRQVGDKPEEALILLEKGYKYVNEGNTTQAEQQALQALAIQKNVGYPAVCRAYHAMADESVYHMPRDWVYLSNTYYLLADLNLVRGDLNQMLFYILEAVKSVEASGLKEELDYAYYRLGNAYYDLNQFEKSIEYYRQSLAISNKYGQIFIQIGLIRRMVTALLKAGKAREALVILQDITHKNFPLTYEKKMIIAQSYGACYNALKQYELAEKYYLEGVAWSKESALQWQYTAWQRLSQFYVENAQYAKADPYLKWLLNASRKYIPLYNLKEIHLMRFKVDSAQANFRVAITHYQHYKALNDSIFNEKTAKQIAQLSIQYETAKKEQELKLKEKNIALLTEQSKTQQTQRNALVGGTGLLLAILGLGYNRYRLKQRSNQQLRAQKQALQARQEEINQKNTSLQLLLTEKEWLLKEIHHRVKNNLQVVMSLLNSQASYLSDGMALSAIQESQNRVQAMALIHQKLYQSERVARISMPSYIQDVIAYLQDSYHRSQPFDFQLEVESIELDVNLAVPLGLIINEAITNIFKYAFPAGRSGTVKLDLHQLDKITYKLTIADDGVGLPKGYDPSRSRSLGMTLMYGFSAQLGGELSIISPPGMSIELVFEEEQLAPPVGYTSSQTVRMPV